MKNKVVCSLLSALMVFGSVPITALAEDDNSESSVVSDLSETEIMLLNEDDFDYTTGALLEGTYGKAYWFEDTGTLYVAMSKNSINSNNVPWKSIRDKISKVIVLDGVKTVGTNAFYGCLSLKEVVISDSVTSIGDDAFFNCQTLTEIVIPDSVTSIGDSAFKNCIALTEIVIPEKVTSIGNHAFDNCTKITEIVIPEKVTSIGTAAFYACDSLTEIKILGSVASIGQSAFYCHKTTETNLVTESSVALNYGWSGDNRNVNVVSPSPIEKPFVFTDVDTSSWMYTGINYVYQNDIMSGKQTDKFDPTANMTRAEFVTTLYSMESKPDVTYVEQFRDVPAGQWYTNPVLWAYSNSVVSGYLNGNYGVSDNIQREQLALMLYKYAAMNGYDTSAESGVLDKFADNDRVSSWAKTAMEWAVTHGIISGKGNASDPENYRLDPTGNATRAECAAMLRSFCTAFTEK